jgi:RNA polymerase sigma-70 factor (ECF subfamily)
MHSETSPCGGPDQSQADALKKLYVEHGSVLLAWAIRFTADRGRAEDLVQETFLRAWRHLPGLLDDERPVRAWLLQVMRRLLIDAERARRVRPLLLESQPTFEPAVDDGLDRLMTSAVVRAAIDRLSGEQRELVIDTFFRDIPLHVTARRLGVPAGTARSRLHYALARMRRYLGDSALAA